MRVNIKNARANQNRQFTATATSTGKVSVIATPATVEIIIKGKIIAIYNNADRNAARLSSKRLPFP